MKQPRRIAVLTGTRAEFGLLRPVMQAIDAHDELTLITLVTGAHLLPPTRTIDEIAAQFRIDATFEMQRAGDIGRLADAAAVGRGISALTAHLPALDPDVMLVLGDRIEAFAGAAAASIAGMRVAHLHGGDRAEGVADESMRHAITKLAHIHLPATHQSAQRIERLGEDAARIHVVGSPAADELADMPALDDDAFEALGRPEFIVLMHPIGRANADESRDMQVILEQCAAAGRVLALDPNHDPGRDGIVMAIEQAGVRRWSHLPRRAFIGLLRRCRALVGNSSAGLIEAAILGTPAVNIGRRQHGRERLDSVIDVDTATSDAVAEALTRAVNRGRRNTPHPYGDGRTGPRVAAVLAGLDPAAHPITKCNTF